MDRAAEGGARCRGGSRRIVATTDLEPPGCVTLWRLPESVEEAFDARWEHWLDHAGEWTAFFEKLESLSGTDLTDVLRSFELVEARDLEAYGKLKRLAEGRAVPLPGIFSGTDADILYLLHAMRDEKLNPSKLVAMVGYPFIHTAKANDKYPAERRRLDGVDAIFVGGDTRYGLGRLHRTAFDLVKHGGAFGGAVTLDAEIPQVEASTAWAHAHAQASLSGALELLGGWDRGSLRRLDQAAPLWQPGSRSANPIRWSIEADGLWKAMP